MDFSGTFSLFYVRRVKYLYVFYWTSKRTNGQIGQTTTTRSQKMIFWPAAFACVAKHRSLRCHTPLFSLFIYIYISIKHLPYSAIPFMHRPSPNLKFDAFTWTKRTIFIKFMHVKLWIWFSCQWSFYVRRRICICNKFSLLVGKIVGGSGWCGADGGMGGVRTTVSDTATNIRPVFNGETKTTKTTNRARPITIHSQQRAINLQKIYN